MSELLFKSILGQNIHQEHPGLPGIKNIYTKKKNIGWEEGRRGSGASMPPLNLAFVTKVRVAFCPFFNVAACRYRPASLPPPSTPCARRWASKGETLRVGVNEETWQEVFGQHCRCALTLPRDDAGLRHLATGSFCSGSRRKRPWRPTPSAKSPSKFSTTSQTTTKWVLHCSVRAVCACVHACVHPAAGRAAIICVHWSCLRDCSTRPWRGARARVVAAPENSAFTLNPRPGRRRKYC
jgi:hypothetical protein